MSDVNGFLSTLDDYPRTILGHYPTPIDSAPNFSQALGIELHIKRDDCTGLAFGGNKARQLEYYLGEAEKIDADTILITGAVQSNFVRMAAAAARRKGMEIHIQLEERVANDNPSYQNSGNVLLDRLLGAHLSTFHVGEDESAADRSLDEKADALRKQGRSPYVIHLGIDHPPIGALGYVQAAVELSQQWKASGMAFDAVVVASGSGLTHGGLLTGLRALGHTLPVYGICVRRPEPQQRQRMQRRCREIATLLGQPDLIQDSDLLITDSVLAPGYGKLNDATYKALHMAATLEGIILDPVYTAKTMAGLMVLVDSGVIKPQQKILYMHTGGLPAVFGYQADLEEFMTQAKQ